MRLHKVLTVDPGWHTAMCFWMDNEIYSITQIDILKEKLTTEEKLHYMSLHFEKNYLFNTAETVYIEGVELWKESARSQMSSSKGHTFTLAYLVGMYCQIVSKLRGDFKIIMPSKWKGQMNNEILRNRVSRLHTFDDKPSEHILCAAGIGYHLQGVL